MTTRWRFKYSDEQLFLLIAILIGVYAGLAVVCFRELIDVIRLNVLGSALNPPAIRVLVAPAVTGIVVAALVIWFFPMVRGSGVNQTKAALYIYDGFIPFRTIVGKFITSALAIGSGHSLGPEDPSLQIGAGLASSIGRRLHLPRNSLRYIAPVGAAAGIAAAFNSPITAVLFVIEEVIGGWSAGVLGAVILAAVSAVVTVQWFLGDRPLFTVPAYHLAHPSELLAYAVLGVAGGGLSLIFVKMLGGLRPRLRALPVWTWYLQPAVAGLLIGVIAIWFPQVMGAGYEVVDQAMHDQYTWQVLLALCLLKVVATTASFVSGVPGGMFAPTLFIGAMLGGAVCGVERLVAPGVIGPTGAYALVGMGTMFAGTLRAPMTSVFMIVEVSSNYSIILPVMISNTIAYFVSRQFQRDALFDLLAHQDGVDLPSMEEEREARAGAVEDVMHAAVDALLLSPKDSVRSAAARVAQLEGETFLVPRDAGWGAVGRAQLIEMAKDPAVADLPLASCVDAIERPYPYPDQSLETALRLLRGRKLVPVVHRADTKRMVGVLRLDDVLQTYGADRSTPIES
jgi:CIC family chloride channel protein